MTQPTFINLHPDKYVQQLHYYPFEVNLVRCVGVVILFLACLTKYLFHTKQKI